MAGPRWYLQASSGLSSSLNQALHPRLRHRTRPSSSGGGVFSDSSGVSGSGGRSGHFPGRRYRSARLGRRLMGSSGYSTVPSSSSRWVSSALFSVNPGRFAEVMRPPDAASFDCTTYVKLAPFFLLYASRKS
eukprot:scaffold7403_cov277-Pinguiococcus_pyrenoidosus.AAC.2